MKGPEASEKVSPTPSENVGNGELFKHDDFTEEHNDGEFKRSFTQRQIHVSLV